MADHTPGPWAIRSHFAGKDHLICHEIHDHNRSGRGFKPIATVHTGFTCTDADADLIAAAPDLLAACEAAEQTLVALGQEDGELTAGEGRTGLRVIFQLRKAVKKAKSS